MTEITDRQAKEPPALPAWVNIEALGDKINIQYRKEYGPIGVLLVNALARWVNSMLPVAKQPGFDFDGDVREAIDSALGFDALDYVTTFAIEIGEALDNSSGGDAHWSPSRKRVWEVVDPPGWFDMRLGGEPWAGALAREVRALGAEVIWPIEDRAERLAFPTGRPDLDQLAAATSLVESYGLVVTAPESLRDDLGGTVTWPEGSPR